MVQNSSPQYSKNESDVYADEITRAKALGWQKAWCVKEIENSWYSTYKQGNERGGGERERLKCKKMRLQRKTGDWRCEDF